MMQRGRRGDGKANVWERRGAINKRDSQLEWGNGGIDVEGEGV